MKLNKTKDKEKTLKAVREQKLSLNDPQLELLTFQLKQ
jgi:hypothetical protein